MHETFFDLNISKLGFGLMRLPMIGEQIDLEQTKQMVDTFLQKGFNYFDTAYCYGENGASEIAMREALIKRYPRESYYVATKLPIWELKGDLTLQKLFDISLERTGADYFDFYLLHNLGEARTKAYEDHNAWEFVQQMKQKGLIRHIGFSFHDTADRLDEVLTKHPEAEFVQLQINYIDWDNPSVQSRKCYEVARKHNKPVIIMEPVKGGALANVSKEVANVFTAANPNASVASWAVRFAASLPGVMTVLSGMSSPAQLEDNTSFMSKFTPLTDDERSTIDKAIEILNSAGTIPCTNCKYCVEGCPQSINIPAIFTATNNFKVFQNLEQAKGSYLNDTKEGGKASDCIACGACEGVCPQHIHIIDSLKEAASIFD